LSSGRHLPLEGPEAELSGMKMSLNEKILRGLELESGTPGFN
jgi:hypothetical protein